MNKNVFELPDNITLKTAISGTIPPGTVDDDKLDELQAFVSYELEKCLNSCTQKKSAKQINYTLENISVDKDIT